ncbi:aldehyde dehydrogenase family protein [Aminobacter sp. BA135]|uniref:aldehyde dehydrogenase family protein n=1 Tax=Aminobacter sp. BA135 TaxID=537596 RepID=UPI003D7B308B
MEFSRVQWWRARSLAAGCTVILKPAEQTPLVAGAMCAAGFRNRRQPDPCLQRRCRRPHADQPKNLIHRRLNHATMALSPFGWAPRLRRRS